MHSKSNKPIVKGVRWASTAAGIKAAGNGAAPLDLALMEVAAGSTLAAVFTRNAFAAAPVQVALQNLAKLRAAAHQQAIYCLVNAGNANAGTGSAGIDAARSSCEQAATQLAVPASAVLPFSTGVIGEPLPLAKIEAALPGLVGSLSASGWDDAARAIMTTDTVPKCRSYELDIDGVRIGLSGIAKGAGMIKPNMATMLAFVATDAAIDQADLDALLQQAVNCSFNRITVDGDTSTNDACVLAASGAAGLQLQPQTPAWQALQQAVRTLLTELATDIIRDAEGASKFITIDVCGGASSDECLQVGYAVAESPLVKTAFFASDANWGRILAAIGRAGVEQLDIAQVEIMLADYCICSGGGRVAGYDEGRAAEIMAQPEITLTINL
ncbi:MAG: bifunctional glutamate N-acetyltransferase/amino-acid acetyltransferase ArgJ, partial [Pseudomonadales bacterium]|nr:bifunctional glutamate N-acetyltransferase/amino-acid acetyltransferase ArgJ [Pseudomonadales bacterium]